MSEITIAVDISKDTLDAHRLPEGMTRNFANTPAGYKDLIARGEGTGSRWVRIEHCWALPGCGGGIRGR